MKKEMFENILQSGEEVIWAEGINKKAYNLKNLFRNIFIIAFLSLFFSFFIGGPASAFMSPPNSNIDETSFLLQTVSTLWIIIFSTSFTTSIVINALNAKNTYFAITNKRVIKRSGAFNNTFTHYSLKNVGNINVSGGFFDSKGKGASANLIIVTKDFHTNTDGNSHPQRLMISSLNHAYDAYKLLSEKTEGNNEVLRVKTEK